MSAPSVHDLLACAVAASNAAAEHAMTNLHRRSEADSLHDHDVKLALDRECQAVAEAVIRKRYPDHSILGEESTERIERPGVLWIIDPIDGTVNFSHGLHHWCNSIAVQVDGVRVAGVVQAPQMRETFTASIEDTARLNGEPIRVSTVPHLQQAISLTGIARTYLHDEAAFGYLRAVSGASQKVRLLGAAALDLCQVAAGRVEAFFESGIYLWDMAAGDLIVQRAGGQTTVLERLEPLKIRYFASNGLVHDELGRVLRAAKQR